VGSTVHIDGNRGWGGGQQQALGLALALAARGDETAFIVQRGSALAGRLRATYLMWEETELRGLRGMGAALRLARRLRELGPQIVHIHDSASHAAAGLAARLAGGPKVVVTRRTDFPMRGGWVGRAKYELWCDRLICISEAVHRRCVEAGLSKERLAVIPDFVDCRHFAPGAGPPIEREERPTIAAVGRLAREKGHRVLLRAMRRVVQEVPQARLVISGEGGEEALLRRQTEAAGLSSSVQFAGFVPDVRAVLSGADVFVMPSLSEGLGGAVLEAMAMGKPTVVSEAGGLPESVVHGETGLVVPAGDAEALAAGVTELLKDRERAREMGRAGRERALAMFDRSRVVERVLALYEEILGGAGT